MRNSGELERENEALRDRLSRLSEASLRINERLDFETVLQGGGQRPRHRSPDRRLCAAQSDDGRMEEGEGPERQKA